MRHLVHSITFVAVVGLLTTLVLDGVHAFKQANPYGYPMTQSTSQEKRWITIDWSDPTVLDVRLNNIQTYIPTKGLQITIRTDEGRTVTVGIEQIRKAVEGIR